ncbi:complex III assembly factor LYRM7-like [Macrosteles quadrilineatus]|uniref:complex III assembly factor LYRM7-like n=1 Tax=Macrosteles quadrilineatus TaxID=74068 RepID=UPI0023E25085|nr:complex III assembly factor LYRM7-like [Macrosteles quadrilineatus]
MMTSHLRREVLRAFKGLHKARKSVFEGDEHALQLTRAKINEEYQKNKHVEDKTKIEEMIKFSKDVETELKTTVVQAREVEPLKYEVRFRDETVRMDNKPYQDVPEEILMANMKKGGKKCGDVKKT